MKHVNHWQTSPWLTNQQEIEQDWTFSRSWHTSNNMMSYCHVSISSCFNIQICSTSIPNNTYQSSESTFAPAASVLVWTFTINSWSWSITGQSSISNSASTLKSLRWKKKFKTAYRSTTTISAYQHMLLSRKTNNQRRWLTKVNLRTIWI